MACFAIEGAPSGQQDARMLPLPRLVAVALLVLASSLVFAFGAAEPKGDSRFVELEGAKVHYTSYGSGETALLFVHGWACDETVWKQQAPALAGKMRAITIDLPGHGQSDKPEIKYTMDLYADAMRAVLRDAKVSRAVLVGHSNGTPAIRHFYRRFADQVAALVIVDGGLRPFADAASMEKFLARFRGPDYEQVVTRFVSAMTKDIDDEALRAEIPKTMLQTPQHVAVSEFENSADPEVWKPETIEVPVLMVLAKQPAWSADYEQFVRSIVPNLDYQVWENVSHFIMMEKPREFNDALLAFLQKNGFAR